MIYEIMIGVVSDEVSEATAVLEDVARSFGMDITESGTELLGIDPDDPDADQIDGVLTQARLGRPE